MCKHSFQFVKLHTSNYMYSGTQRLIELALFTIRHLQLCTNEKVIYKTKLDVVMSGSHFADANFCCVSSDTCHRGRHLDLNYW